MSIEHLIERLRHQGYSEELLMSADRIGTDAFDAVHNDLRTGRLSGVAAAGGVTLLFAMLRHSSIGRENDLALLLQGLAASDEIQVRSAAVTNLLRLVQIHEGSVQHFIPAAERSVVTPLARQALERGVAPGGVGEFIKRFLDHSDNY